MSDIEKTKSQDGALELDVPEILQAQFDALWEKIEGDVIGAVESYESDERIGQIDPCYELARFDRRKWDQRKLEKNLRKRFAMGASDEFTTIFPYEPEIGPNVSFLDIATATIPKLEQEGHAIGYTINVFRLTDEFSVDSKTGALVPDVVTYKIGFRPFVEPLADTAQDSADFNQAALV